MRISIDTKATVNVGEYSRGGRSRGSEAVKALDHDMCPKEKLVPGGILEPVTGRLFLFFGTSYKTSDFIVDGLHLWWEERKQDLCGLKQLVINICLLYTSDAADDLTRVDLGGRRIIEKKKQI